MAAELHFRSVCRTDCGRVRTVNQDAFVAVDSVGLWAVSDGMGGHDAGEIASAQVATRLMEIANSPNPPVSKAAVENALRRANSDLEERSATSGLRLGMGATAAVLCANDARYFCLWVGDSRIYRLHDGALALLTHDHRYVQELVDSGVVGLAAARSHPMRNILTRAIGLDPVLQIDECEGTIAREDVFLIATDGVTGILADHEIAAILKHPDLAHAADQFVARCNERGSPDNLTLILVKAT
ncbi:MAG TPA: protein phosphatase 2C domain-containing protein [Candidatus Acidoferrum sp.]|nr:protein phosphatase 2C domain-containing protein [Candidatus Acidoferrum sp.]